MTEEEARQWIIDRFGVPRETILGRFAELLIAESQQQNLISAASVSHLWSRHLADSAQLIPLAGVQASNGVWFDVGSGAGLPGMVVAVLTDLQVVLVEPRKRRASFLEECAAAIGLSNRVTVHALPIERVAPAQSPAVVSARAVAALPELLKIAYPITSRETVWILPKGRSAESEVAAARRSWHGRFDLMPSVTDEDARIILIREVAPK